MLRFPLFACLIGLLTAPAAFAEEMAEPFDTPVKSETVDLPKDPQMPDSDRTVTCDSYPGYMIKTVDFGEVGADSISMVPVGGACAEKMAGEQKFEDDLMGYFLGAKGDYLFFQAADGWNGGLPFVVFNAKTKARLFDDSTYLGENGDAQLFSGIDVEGDKLSIKFTRVYSAECSLIAGGAECEKAILDATGLAKVPDCKPAYDAEKKRTPDYASEVDAAPSVIVYPASLTFDGKESKVVPTGADAACRVPT